MPPILSTQEETPLTYEQLLADRDAWRERAETAVAANEGLQAALHDATRHNQRLDFELGQSRGVIKDLGELVVKAHTATEEIQAQNAQLAELALRDPLTGLLNRRTADGEYERLRPHGTRRLADKLSLMLLDLDDFKGINDTHGHEVGDTALKKVAHILIQSTREADVAFRWGGEEFLLMLPGTDEAGAQMVAEHLRQIIKEEAITTASIGVAEVKPNEALELVIGRTDSAMYEAKKRGRNMVVLFSQLADM